MLLARQSSHAVREKWMLKMLAGQASHEPSALNCRPSVHTHFSTDTLWLNSVVRVEAQSQQTSLLLTGLKEPMPQATHSPASDVPSR